MNNEISLKQAINQLVDTYRLRGKLTESKLVESWEDLMGKTIAKHTTSLKLNKTLLIVHLDSSVVRQELSYAKEKIIKKLNDQLGNAIIEDIHFK